MAAVDVWPLLGLRVRAPRVELRYPDDELVVAIAELAARGIHPPEQMPFSVPWTDAPAERLPRDVAQYYWRQRGELAPTSWWLDLAVLVDGEVVGVQGVGARDFAVRRTVVTGSWVGLAHQGRGIGTAMRRAVLHLAFAGLRADAAESDAFEDNAVSLAITRKLGYEPNGDELYVRRNVVARVHRFRMDRARWEAIAVEDDVAIDGLEPCLALLGASSG